MEVKYLNYVTSDAGVSLDPQQNSNCYWWTTPRNPNHWNGRQLTSKDLLRISNLDEVPNSRPLLTHTAAASGWSENCWNLGIRGTLACYFKPLVLRKWIITSRPLSIELAVDLLKDFHLCSKELFCAFCIRATSCKLFFSLKYIDGQLVTYHVSLRLSNGQTPAHLS